MTMLVLKRIASNSEATLGVLLKDNLPLCLTLENPWLENKVRVSCIPGATQYVCTKVDSPKFGKTWQVNKVRGRTHILFHKGNTAEDTLGCIVLGSYYGELFNRETAKYKLAVLNSKRAFKFFMGMMANEDEFTLRITWHDGSSYPVPF